MRLVLIGAPGSGKGTQAARLADHFGVPHISSGERLRAEVAAGSALGRQVAGHLDRGELVPDDVVTAVVAEALTAESPGYVLEGFPRTVAQAPRVDTLNRSGGPDAVVFLELPDDVARRRLIERAPAGRSDDRDPAVIDRRLAKFHAETEPVVDYYRDRGILTTVDAAQAPDAVLAAVLDALEDRGPA
jgi:adenylate kinase